MYARAYVPYPSLASMRDSFVPQICAVHTHEQTYSPSYAYTCPQGETEDSKAFLHNIRGYNSSIALASVRAPGLCEDLANGEQGVYTYSIQGALYHMVGPLEAAEDEVPRFAQIYFIDEAQQADVRNSHFRGSLAPEILSELQAIVREHNPFLSQFKYALEVLRESPNAVAIQLTIRPDMVPGGSHERVYNAPTIPEVAAIIPEPDKVNRPCDIILHKRGGGVQIISHTHPHYDTLHYMVFHMRGGFGWHMNIPHVGETIDPLEEEPSDEDEGEISDAEEAERVARRKAKKKKTVTISKFYSYRLMVRRGMGNVLHYGKRLFQQYIVDMFCKQETNNMNFLRFNQDKLRVSTYRVVQQLADSGGALGDVGKHIILPSSYIGSPRHVHQLYCDAMAIVREHGKPSLFITMTCNPGMPWSPHGVLIDAACVPCPVIAHEYVLRLQNGQRSRTLCYLARRRRIAQTLSLACSASSSRSSWRTW
jgi:hypothetical protein